MAFSKQVLVLARTNLEDQKISMPAISHLAPAKTFPIVRYAYYLFVFSIPIETLDTGLEKGLFSLSKLAGIMFIAVALLQPAVCFKTLPRPFWYFSFYGLVCLGLADYETPQIRQQVFMQLFTFGLLMTLFWISYNLLQDKSLLKGTLVSFVGSCVLLTGLMLTGSGESLAQGRMTALSQNSNVLGATLSLGLLALLGLTYGRDDVFKRIKIIVWCSFGAIAVGMVLTGSRTAMVTSVVGILLFIVTKRGNLALKIRIAFIGILAIAALVWLLFQNDAARTRWERTIYQGDQSRREEIHPAAWDMFMEKPLLGWGPVSHYLELGARFKRPAMDPHNLYLWVMIETGLLGSVPFFIGLWMCLRGGWRATYGAEGPLPIIMLTSMFLVGLSGSFHLRKIFWIVLAYNLASESFVRKQEFRAYDAGSVERTPDHLDENVRKG